MRRLIAISPRAKVSDILKAGRTNSLRLNPRTLRLLVRAMLRFNQDFEGLSRRFRYTLTVFCRN